MLVWLLRRGGVSLAAEEWGVSLAAEEWEGGGGVLV